MNRDYLHAAVSVRNLETKNNFVREPWKRDSSFPEMRCMLPKTYEESAAAEAGSFADADAEIRTAFS